MKWLSRTIQGLLIALLVALGTAMFQKPLIEMTGLVPVKAEITSFEWHPSYERYKPKRPQSGDAIKDLLKDLEEVRDNKLQPDALYIIEISNNSDKPIEDVKVSVNDETFYDVLIESVTKDSKAIQQNDLSIGQIGSNDKKTIRLWAGSSLISQYGGRDNLRIESKGGVIPFSVKTLEPLTFDSEESAFAIVDDSIPYVIGVLFFVSLLAMGAYEIISEAYYKDLLANDELYVREKVRFELDYKNFSIKPERLGAYFKRF